MVEQRLDSLFGTGWTPRDDGNAADAAGEHRRATEDPPAPEHRSAAEDRRGDGAPVGAREFRRVVRWRIDPGRRAAAAMVAVVAATALLVGWRVLADRPRAEAVGDSANVRVSVPPSGSVAARTVGAAGAGPSGAVAAGISSSQAGGPRAPIVVDVVGKVHRPGIVTLAAGSRVNDAVHAAGGALPRTSLTAVNLARVCVDGEQIVIGQPATAAVSTGTPSAPAGSGAAIGATPAPGALINLNTASVDQLDALPGVGPVMAQRIVDWRTTHGTFQSVDQLKQVSGIGDAKYADISPLATV